MRYVISLLLSAGISAAVLPAQNIVSPRGMTNIYGGINNSIPWGSFQSAQQFCQQVHDDLLGKTVKIKGMAFRHAWDSNYAARSYTATLTLGECATKAVKLSSAFASNWRSGGSKTQVVKGTISFPAFTAYASAPGPFDAVVSFSTPYSNTGKHSLMWEVHISSNSGNTPTHYFERGPGSTHRPGVIGKGCAMSGRTKPLTSSGGINTSAMAEQLANGPATGSALIVFGDNSDKWSGQKLPFSLAFAGSPACFINVNSCSMKPTSNSAL